MPRKHKMAGNLPRDVIDEVIQDLGDKNQVVLVVGVN